MGTFYSAGVLLGIGWETSVRLADRPPLQPGNSDALIAMVFSAAGLEALINEVADQAQEAGAWGDPNGHWGAFAEAMREIEEAKGSTRLKYQIAAISLDGRPFDNGRQPFQDFLLLFRIRDALIHLKLSRVPFESLEGEPARPSRLVADLIQRSIAAPSNADWTTQISTPRAAWWACDVAAQMAAWLVRLGEPCGFSRKLQALYLDPDRGRDWPPTSPT